MQAQTVAKEEVISLVTVLIPQVAVRLVTLLLRIEEAPGSNLGLETGYQNRFLPYPCLSRQMQGLHL
jgi:hypothetical protein